MPNRRSVEGEYRVEGSALDEPELDRLPSAAEAGLHFLGLYGTSELVPFPSVAGHFVRGSAWAAHGLPLRPGFIFWAFTARVNSCPSRFYAALKRCATQNPRAPPLPSQRAPDNCPGKSPTCPE